jgi:hypothetical protein
MTPHQGTGESSTQGPGERRQGQRKARAANITIGHSRFGQRAKRDNFKSGIFRDSDPANGEPETVAVKCKACGWVREDPEPAFLTLTGQYLARILACDKCPLPAGLANRKHPPKVFVPVSKTLKFVEQSGIAKKLRDPATTRRFTPKLDPVRPGPGDDPEPSDEEEERPRKKRSIFAMN